LRTCVVKAVAPIKGEYGAMVTFVTTIFRWIYASFAKFFCDH